MSEVSTRPHVGATKAPAKAKAAPTPAPAPIAPRRAPRAELSEDDHCAVAVGCHIFHLIRPIVEGSFDATTVTGYSYISAACDFAWDLNNIEEECNENGPAPTVAQLIPKIHTDLQRAMVEIVADRRNHHSAMMYCVRLLVAEALSLSSRLLDAYRGLPGSSATLSALANFPKFHCATSPTSVQAGQEGEGPTADEQLVAATLREQVLAIHDAHWETLRMASSELLIVAAEVLGAPTGGIATAHRAAQLLAGAIAVEQAEVSGSKALPHLEAVHHTLGIAAASYDTDFEGGETVAEGIRAGLRQFRDRPTAPIRRVNGPEDDAYNQLQLRSILTAVAGVAVTLDQVLMNAQTAENKWDTGVLIDAAQVLARHLGGMADSAVGGSVLGSHDRWNYGPNFAQEGKAGAA